jgi:response regulator RpfG family c-di-GMP phosphodiesterase
VRRSLAPPGSSPFIDVWDALSYDRPYRRAWPRHQVLDYIRDQAGALFDPRMVEAFLDVAPYRTLTPAAV